MQILQAVKHMHENNVVHRDLKLQNILLHKMQIKICDMGLAAEMDSENDRKM